VQVSARRRLDWAPLRLPRSFAVPRPFPRRLPDCTGYFAPSKKSTCGHAVLWTTSLLLLRSWSSAQNIDRHSNLPLQSPLLKDGWYFRRHLGTFALAFFLATLPASSHRRLAGVPLQWTWGPAADFLLWSVATAATGFDRRFAACFCCGCSWASGIRWPTSRAPAPPEIFAPPTTNRKRSGGWRTLCWMSGCKCGPRSAPVGGIIWLRFGWRPFFFRAGSALSPGCFFGSNGCRLGQDHVTTRSAQSPGSMQDPAHRSAWATLSGCFAATISGISGSPRRPYYRSPSGISPWKPWRHGSLPFLCSAAATPTVGGLDYS